MLLSLSSATTTGHDAFGYAAPALRARPRQRTVTSGVHWASLADGLQKDSYYSSLSSRVLSTSTQFRCPVAGQIRSTAPNFVLFSWSGLSCPPRTAVFSGRSRGFVLRGPGRGPGRPSETGCSESRGDRFYLFDNTPEGSCVATHSQRPGPLMHID